MKNIFFSFACLLLCLPAFASHFSSVDIRYEYTGTGNVYRVYLTLGQFCEGGAFLNTTEAVSISSSCTPAFTKMLTSVFADTSHLYCAGNLSSCNNTGTIYPGYITRIYTDTVTLNSCSDWKISWTNCCRNASIINLYSSSSQGVYIEAFLDNSIDLNSSPKIVNPPVNFAVSNQFNTIPLQTVDAENDSIVFEWYVPKSSPTANCGYAISYSLTNPTSGTTQPYIDAVSQQLHLNPNMQGKFALALRVKDYRNGQLVGYSSRDFTLNIYSLSTAYTTPLPASGTQFYYNTCPGQNNTINLSFLDSTATDSVFLEVAQSTYPIALGLNINATINPGLAAANASITWTTPLSLNPATIPFFYINIKARDNACPLNAYSYYTIVVNHTQCVTDSVWAGDANGDYTVNVYDPLAVAVGYGSTGTARPMATTNWQAEYCPNWTDTFINGVNNKHADCNGDGIINNADLAAISSNYGSVHQKPSTAGKPTAGPDLYFDTTGIVFAPGAMVSVPIKLGTASTPMNNFYGIATAVYMAGIVPNYTPTITYPNSWLGNNTTTVRFQQPLGNTAIDWAYARNNHTTINGNGTLANFNFQVPATATNGQAFTLEFFGTKLIDSIGNTLNNFNPMIATVNVVAPTGIHQIGSLISHATITPNPSNHQATLTIVANEDTHLNLSITDITGKSLVHKTMIVTKGETKVGLPSTFSSGLYFVSLKANNASTTLKWIIE